MLNFAIFQFLRFLVLNITLKHFGKIRLSPSVNYFPCLLLGIIHLEANIIKTKLLTKSKTENLFINNINIKAEEP